MRENTVNGSFSVSIFAVEVDRVPTFAVQGRKQQEAEAVLADEGVREQLRRMTSGGKPLCDDFSIFRMRIANQREREIFYRNASSLLTTDGGLAVLLVQLDSM